MRALPLAIAVMCIALICLSGAAYGDSIPLGAASKYAILFEGTGGHNLQITNVNINGNIGVGGTGVVQFNGPATINGQVDFSASAVGQFHNNNGANVGPTSVDYSFTNVLSALATVNSLSTTLGAEPGTSLAINGNQTINASSGALQVVNGHQYRVFNITAYSETDGKVVTIVGDTAGDIVVLNFNSALGNVNLKGDVKLTGLTDDQVLWNFSGSGKNINLNTNASSFGSLAFQGDILGPDDILSMTNANLDGRFFGGDSADMQIVSGSSLNTPTVATVPETSSLLLLGTGLLAIGSVLRRRVRPA